MTFPPFVGCISALILSYFFDLSSCETFFDKLSSTLVPLALFSIGIQLKLKGWKKQITQVSLSLIYKLILAPLIVCIIFSIFAVRNNITKISIFESAMPTLLTSSIVAEQYHLNTKLVNLIIGICIIVGFVTTFLWQYWLNNFY